MSNVSNQKTHNFDPNNYTTQDYRKKDGSYQLTDYQAALTVRNWMHDNMPGGMMDHTLIDQVNAQKDGPGPVTVDLNGKKVTLTDQEKAAFLKFRENGSTLFRRLDGGENGTHDFLMGEWDIDQAIKNGRLHGSAEHSKEGHWRNRNGDMPHAQAAEVLDDYLTEKFGSDWSVKQGDLRQIANSHGMYVPNENGYEFVMIDDPEVIRAAGLVLDDWSNVQNGEGNSVGILSQKELDKYTKM